MSAILHKIMPLDMRKARGLPGVQPLDGPWLRTDEAYGAQMVRRDVLLRDRVSEVVAQCPESEGAIAELLDEVLALLPGLGFSRDGDTVTCPDGRRVRLSDAAGLVTLGRLVQCDFCILEKTGDEHVLNAAVLCFPASWRLAEKIGRPLAAIHAPVDEYDPDLAKRVQRLFDGVRVGHPLWRFNQLWYSDPELFQPRSALDPVRVDGGPAAGAFLRMERQTIFRLPRSGQVVFSIHTTVLRACDTPFAGQG